MGAPPRPRARPRKRARPGGRSALEQRVDERRHRRALREYDEQAQEGEHEDDGPQPPLLADLHEGPELAQDSDLLARSFECHVFALLSYAREWPPTAAATPERGACGATDALTGAASSAPGGL